MNCSDFSFRIDVELTNPGQFLACCGLLEVADRLCPGSEGWFAEGSFCVSSDYGLRKIIESLVAVPAVELSAYGPSHLATRPLLAPIQIRLSQSPDLRICLDTWAKVVASRDGVALRANTPWNFWSGQQTSAGIWNGLRNYVRHQLSRPDIYCNEKLFSHQLALRGRFGFDPGPAWNSIDVGFSPNEQGMEVKASAIVELLAAVGVQRFRLPLSTDKKTVYYSTWCTPLTASIAAGAIAVDLIRPRSTFSCGFTSRGEYTALTHSHRVPTKDHHESH